MRHCGDNLAVPVANCAEVPGRRGGRLYGTHHRPWLRTAAGRGALERSL